MILEKGSKVLAVHRRLFETDHSRFFIGVVDGYEDGLARITGTTWLRDQVSGSYRVKKDERTKILSLTSGTCIFYELPMTTDLSAITFSTDGHGGVFMTDGGALRMDLTERMDLATNSPL